MGQWDTISGRARQEAVDAVWAMVQATYAKIGRLPEPAAALYEALRSASIRFAKAGGTPLHLGHFRMRASTRQFEDHTVTRSPIAGGSLQQWHRATTCASASSNTPSYTSPVLISRATLPEPLSARRAARITDHLDVGASWVYCYPCLDHYETSALGLCGH
jgi:hypothetical protein